MTATQQQSENSNAQETFSTSRPPMDAVFRQTERRQSIRANAAQFLGVPPDKVCGLLRNVWSTSKGQADLTDHDMLMGMSLIARYGLDPMAREIYVSKDGKGRLMTIIAIDGWIKILDKTEGYDGFEQSRFFDDSGNIVSITTTIFSTKRSHPASYTAYAREYMQVGGFVSGQMPIHMLGLFSLRHAARLFTPIGGSVISEDEARWMQAYDDLGPVSNVQDDIPTSPRASKVPIPQTKKKTGTKRAPQPKPETDTKPQPKPETDTKPEEDRDSEIREHFEGLEMELAGCTTTAQLLEVVAKYEPRIRNSHDDEWYTRRCNEERQRIGAEGLLGPHRGED